MPKNNTSGTIRIPKIPAPATKRPGASQQSGSGGGVLPPTPVILHLVRLDSKIVSELGVGDSVILAIDGLPIVVTTLLGNAIGQVRLDDAEEVRARRIRTAIVVLAQTDPLRCTVESE